MPKKLDAKAAAAAVQEKQQLEVAMAWELLEVFNTDGNKLRPELRDCASLVLQEMIAIRDGIDKDGEKVVQEAIDAEKAIMAILKKPRAASKLKDPGKVESGAVDKAAKLGTLLKEAPTMDCQEISDVVRLYGTFVEKAAKNKVLKDFYEDVEKKKDGFRKGTEKVDKKMVWNQGKDGEKAGRHRQAMMTDEWKKIVEGLEIAKVPKNEILDLTVQFLAEASAEVEKSSRGAVQNFLVSMEGGQKIFALKDTSTVGKIDQAFGLVPAADISGTTADTMFFFSKFPKLDPLFQMLPLATIVAGAHHSTIEVALPLTQNGIIEYDIGFYSTLLPAKAKHPAAGAVKKALDMAEKEKLNHFLLVWYSKDGKAIEGAYDFDPSEKKQFEAFKKFADGKNALATFSKVKAVDQATIEELMDKNGMK